MVVKEREHLTIKNENNDTNSLRMRQKTLTKRSHELNIYMEERRKWDKRGYIYSNRKKYTVMKRKS